MDLLCLFKNINFSLGAASRRYARPPTIYLYQSSPHPNPISLQPFHNFSSCHHLPLCVQSRQRLTPYQYDFEDRINRVERSRVGSPSCRSQQGTWKGRFKGTANNLGGGITESAASKRWSQVKQKVYAGKDATSTDSMGEMSSNKRKVSSFDGKSSFHFTATQSLNLIIQRIANLGMYSDAVKKGKRAADDQEGSEAGKVNKNVCTHNTRTV